MFWFLTACLFVLAALFVLLPLLLRSRAQSFESDTLRKNENIAMYHDRTNDLETELSAGNLDQPQFDALILELQQSLLADVGEEEVADKSQSKIKATPDSSSSSKEKLVSLAVPIVLSVLLGVFSYIFYDKWGYIEDVELMSLFERTVNNADNPQESQSLIVELGNVVMDDDSKPWAWYFLAENFASLGLFNEAEVSYRRSADLMDDTREKALVLGRVAMAKYILAEFKFTPDILEVVEQARAINPAEISILQLLAADAEERQDYKVAIDYWRLLIQGNPNSEQADLLRENIASAQQLLAQDGQDVDVGPTIDINLSLAAGIELDERLRVFVAARNAAREGMPPLAVTELTVGDLPATIRLDNSSAVTAFNLSSAETIYVSALISFTGTATSQAGDYRVQSANFAPNGKHASIELLISEQLP